MESTSPVDKPNWEFNPHALWKVTYFDRYHFIDVEVQAPNKAYAHMFAVNSLIRDGVPAHSLSFVSIERIEEPSEES